MTERPRVARLERCAHVGGSCPRRVVRCIAGAWWCTEHVAEGRRALARERQKASQKTTTVTLDRSATTRPRRKR